MRQLIQRVSRACVSVDGKIVGEIDKGILVFVGFCAGDEGVDLDKEIQRVLDMRIYEDERGKMHHSLREVGGGLLVVSQFTLYGDCRSGRRPSFTAAAPGPIAKTLFDRYLMCAKKLHPNRVEQGVFAAHMHVELVNDGPVTLLLDSC